MLISDAAYICSPSEGQRGKRGDYYNTLNVGSTYYISEKTIYVATIHLILNKISTYMRRDTNSTTKFQLYFILQWICRDLEEENLYA